MGPKFTTGLLGETVFSTNKNFTNFRSSKLAAPGFYPTPHSKSLFIENFHSNSYLAGGLNTAYTFAPGFDFRLEGYVFLPVKELLPASDGTLQNAKFIQNYYLQGLAAIVYQTGVGPVSLTLNYYEKEDTKLYFMLNFGYIIFNKRGF